MEQRNAGIEYKLGDLNKKKTSAQKLSLAHEAAELFGRKKMLGYLATQDHIECCPFQPMESGSPMTVS